MHVNTFGATRLYPTRYDVYDRSDKDLVICLMKVVHVSGVFPVWLYNAGPVFRLDRNQRDGEGIEGIYTVPPSRVLVSRKHEGILLWVAFVHVKVQPLWDVDRT